MLSVNHRIRLILILLTVFFIAILAIQPVASLRVESGDFRIAVSKGDTYTIPIAVSIGSQESAGDYAIDVGGFGETPDGIYQSLPASNDTSSFSARPYITVNQPTVHLNPGEREYSNITIRVPANAPDGGRYALILVHPAPAAGGAGSGISTAVQIPVMLTIAGSTLTQTGSITNLATGEMVTGEPIKILTTLKNTGNYHYYGAFVNVTVTDAAGKVVATTSTDPSRPAIIPGYAITFVTPITATLSPGTYTVKADAKLADGMVLLDSKTASFTIQTPYVPPTPTPQATVTVAGGTPIPSYTVPAPAGTTGPNKIPFLPIYTPGPDALMTVGVVSAALLLWSAKRRR
ncbi:MAG: hypothetical protein ABSD81_01425 [Methanomicrobiales archaeon]|jgi:hypothetical protein